MHVLLIPPRRRGPLDPLLGGRGVAELPIVGRSALERALEAVAPLAPARVGVVAAEGAERLEALVGDGRRWGLAAEVVRAGPAGDATGHGGGRYPHADRFVVPCDRLYAVDLGVALAGLVARSDGGRASVGCEATGLAWHPAGAVGAPRRVRLPAADVLVVDSPTAYHAAALAVSRGEHARLSAGGRLRATGLHQGYQTRVHPSSVHFGHAWVGRGCRVHPTARLSGTVVVGDNSTIGRMSSVHDAVVLDDTAVGDHLDIRHAVVGGDTIVRVDTGAVLQVSDRFLLSSRAASPSAERPPGPARRVLTRLRSRAGPAPATDL